MNEDAADLTEAERARILAKSALFDPPQAQVADGRRELVGLTRTELSQEMAAIGEAPFRTKQLWHWIYHRGATNFSRMSSIARSMQEKLAERFVIGRPDVAATQISAGSSCFASATGRRQRRFTSPILPGIAALCVSPRRWAARCPVAFATPAHNG
jgi:hypothetical protein